MRIARRTAGLLIALAIATTVSGCTPEPAPTPTPTGFASEDEAFRAAEETYRAYVDAINARREDENSPVDPRSFLTGRALELDVETQRDLKEKGLHLTGPSVLASVANESFSGSEVIITLCVDSTASRVLDDAGTDVTPPDRDEVIGIVATLVGDPTGLLIAKSETSPETC